MADYDLAMRSRADLQFVYNISHIFPHLRPNSILLPWWSEGYLLCDQFALGAVEPVVYYHRVYDHLRAYAQGREFNPEVMLMTHFEQRPDLHIFAETKQYFFVRRPHMASYTVEQAMVENPGRNKWLDPEIFNSHRAFHQQAQGDTGAAYMDNYRRVQLNKLVEESAEKKTGEGCKP
jgi:hypothetical protein